MIRPSLVLTALISLAGCAETLSVTTHDIAWTARNRNTYPIECGVTLEGYTSTGKTRTRTVYAIVPPGGEVTKHLRSKLGAGDRFLDGSWRSECLPHGHPANAHYLPRIP